MKTKLPEKWSNYLIGLPESGMGYQLVDASFKDGTELKGLKVYNSSEIDIPIPYMTEIVDLNIHGSPMERVAIKMRIKPPKRRSPIDRLKARLYYRRNRAKIRLQRKKYLRKHKTVLKHRRQFLRYKPVWFKKPARPRPKKRFKVKRLS